MIANSDNSYLQFGLIQFSIFSSELQADLVDGEILMELLSRGSLRRRLLDKGVFRP